MPLKLGASLSFDAIGAPWQLDTAEPIDEPTRARLVERIERFDSTWSRFRDDSLVTRVSTTGGVHEFPADAPPLFALYRALYEATDGAVTPLVGRALERLGYDSTYSLRASGVPQRVPAWDDSVAWDGRSLTTVNPVVVDVGAAGKGYLVDLVGDILTDAGISEYLIDASGDLLHRGTDIVRVALEHPLDTSMAIGVAELSNGSLCASASNRRAWGTSHHIIDAATGLPTRDVIATWAVAPTALVADGLATALFFTSADRLSAVADFTYVRMFADGRVEHSADFEGELFA
ncbi:FAD:protein FMN transferase [soil metagenome]